MKNIYYFNTICEIGGIETFLYELAKKYQDKDLTIYYQNGDYNQIQRLKKYVRVKKYSGEFIECEKAFFNFNLDIIDNVKAKEYILVVHGNYNMLGCKPPTHKKLTKVVAVSKDSAKAYTDLTGTPCEVCYNPISKEPTKKIIHLISASRLKDKVKGNNRMVELVKALDKYCEITGNKYIWTIFTDNEGVIKSKNICYMKPRLNIRDYMLKADYVVQLSDNVEGYNYTVNESLLLGTPVIITPCNVYEELGIDDTMAIRLNFDLSNIDEVIEKMFNSNLKVNYKAPDDNWDKLLAKGESTYKEELKMKYKVEALEIYEKEGITDNELGRIPKVGEQWEISKERLDVLLGENKLNKVFVKVVEEKKPKKTTKK